MGLGKLLSGPLPGMAMGVLSSGLQTLRNKYAIKQIAADQAEAGALLDTEGGRIAEQFSNIAGNQAATNSSVLANYAALYGDATTTQAKQQADLLAGYGGRLNAGMAMLDGAGNAQREEIGRQYSALGSQTEAGLRDRGFGGSLLASNALGVQNQKDRSTRALDEQIQQQRLGVYSNLSGDYLNALGAGNANTMNLTTQLGGQVIGAKATAQSADNAARFAQLGYQDSVLNRKMENIRGYPFQAAGPGNVFDATQAGLNSWQSYQAAQAAQDAGKNDWIWPTAVGGALNIGTAGIYGAALGAW